MRIRLVPNTGIQYITLPDLDGASIRSFDLKVDVDNAETPNGRLSNIFPAERVRDDDPSFEDEDRDVTTCSARAGLLLDTSVATGSGLWIPIPFDRGGVWASIFLKPADSDGDTDGELFNAVLAIDTTLAEDGNPQGIEAAELGDRVPASCSRGFWRKPLVAAWVRSTVEKLDSLEGDVRIPRGNRNRAVQTAIAAMAAFLGERMRGSDHVGLVVQFAGRPSRGSEVVVDLVLDLGNSRTCALLSEERPDRREERLELVYPFDPTSRYRCPFQTQMAFVDHEIVSPSSGDAETFLFLSQIRMGPSASELLRQSTVDPQSLGVSSPKRYLWQTRESVAWNWQLANRKEATGVPAVIRGHVLKHMNTARPLSPPAIPELPISPNYPRQACTVWAIIEILEQSFRQINSTEWRRTEANAPLCDQRREIGNLVIMYPAGMHGQEIRNYKDACKAACKHWSRFRTNPELFCQGEVVDLNPEFGVKAPVVQVVCDEALAIQACWLYGEVLYRHKGKVSNVLEHLGRKRGAGDESKQTLRIASLDVGGGSIDLAIADYSHDTSQPTAVALTCTRRFHDGISRAGDEIMKGVLESVVFPAIVSQCGFDRSLWDEIVSRPRSDRHRTLGRRLVRSVWQPLAMECLSRSEGSEDFERKIEDLCDIPQGLLQEMQEELDPSGTAEMPIRNVKIKIDLAQMRKIIRQTVGRTITQCADIVDQFQCDLLLVGGRPSSNPAIREHIQASMAVPPGQVIFLSEARVGDWYPFLRSGGRISDAKTCCVVGGLVVFRALYGYGNFLIRANATTESKPIIGYLRSTGSDEMIEFSEAEVLQLEGAGATLGINPQIGESSGLTIALRRIDHEHAEAKPIYQVRLKQKYRSLLAKNPVHQEQSEIQIVSGQEAVLEERMEVGEQIEMPGGMINDVVELRGVKGEVALGSNRFIDGEDAFEIVLKTMIDGDGYWLDTGRFQPLPSID